MKVATRRLLEEQIAAVVVLGRGEKNDAMRHVPQGYNGHRLPILINYKVIHHTLTYREIILSMIISKHTAYSPTCLTVGTDDKHRY